MDRRSAAARDHFGTFLSLAVSMIAGCTAQPKIDTSYHAVSQDSRVQFIVLHYTEIDFSRSLHRLTKEEVSSHYLVDDQPTTIYRHVEENQRAWHAGQSYWRIPRYELALTGLIVWPDADAVAWWPQLFLVYVFEDVNLRCRAKSHVRIGIGRKADYLSSC
ncbi:MAG: N-acetylmuramoyl-L-alanine amidase [Caballeronia mineralivorans]|jgi:hypothetical protein|nr:N-acetylmuramoyl-L-alanine amidase [Caballeronia mineralivorans]